MKIELEDCSLLHVNGDESSVPKGKLMGSLFCTALDPKMSIVSKKTQW